MPLPSNVLEKLLRDCFQDGVIEIQDLAGDNDHYQVTVLSDDFIGKTRVQQHQMVYQALNGKMGGDLHAMALKTGVLPPETSKGNTL
ncbi:BolA/IbaG family iron-sulfur metabolism protein [Candidatus Finniella inopinata]|uniref:BolA family transcriptional regulator n=1 Tax=Candidatus Finniella inopinata TaxID=1696036 RepID=A0A4Q7DNH4_9PROT|nr:BolA family transcriptional regulator [Candidatus Finniella inopinata]RZI46426.1 BolA family transcriptional regulator [Candidatus Finniella inopinata]